MSQPTKLRFDVQWHGERAAGINPGYEVLRWCSSGTSGEVMKELEAIIEKWRKLGDNLESANRVLEQQWPRQCADELEALLPAQEKAFADLESEVSRYRGNYRGAQAEIAALREPMSCTHPRACWQATKPDSVDAVVGYRCVACEDERLAVAAALRPVAEEMHIQMNGSGLRPSGYGNCRNHGFDDCTSLKCLSAKTGGKALDAHDAALWNEALATFQSKSEFQFNYWLNQGHAPLGAIRIAMDTVYRALKREK